MKENEEKKIENVEVEINTTNCINKLSTEVDEGPSFEI